MEGPGVVAVSALVPRLGDSASPGVGDAGITLGLFVIVWWAWLGQAIYDNRYGRDDAPHPIVVLVGTAGALVLALGVGHAPRTLLLPVGFLLVRASLIVLTQTSEIGGGTTAQR